MAKQPPIKPMPIVSDIPEEDTSLRQYWHVLRRYRIQVFLVMVVTAVAGVLYSFTLKDVYVSSTMLRKTQGSIKTQSSFTHKFNKDDLLSDVVDITQSESFYVKALTYKEQVKRDVEVRLGKTLTVSDESALNALSVDTLRRSLSGRVSLNDKGSSVSLRTSSSESRALAALMADMLGYALRDLYNAQFKDRYLKRIQSLQSIGDKKRVRIEELEVERAQLFGNKISDSEMSAAIDPQDLLPEMHRRQTSYQDAKLEQDLLIEEINASKLVLGIPNISLDKIIWVEESSPMRQRLAQLKLRRSELLTRYTKNNPVISKIDKEIGFVEKELSREAIDAPKGSQVFYVTDSQRAVVQTLRDRERKLHVLDFQIKALAAQIANLKTKIAAKPDLRTRQLQKEKTILENIVRELDREIQHANVLYETSDNALATTPRVSLGHTQASDKTRVIVLSMALGLFLGCVVAFLLHSWDDTVRSSADLKRAIHYPVLGVIPFWDTKEAYIDPNIPDSSISEIYGVVRNNIKFTGSDSPEKCLMVASAVQNEGKSHTSINLAVSFALEGSSVLLTTIDFRTERNYGALRKPGDTHPMGPGFTDYLEGNLSKEDLIIQSKVENLYMVPSGHKASNPTRLLKDERLTEFFEAAQAHFDVIIVDAPATLPVVDSSVVAHMVRGVLLVVEAGKTPLSVLEQAINRLEHVESPVIGAVVNKARDLGLDSFYGSGYSYYPNYYKSYYKAGYKASYRSTYKSSESS